MAVQNIEIGCSVTRMMVIHVIKKGDFYVKFLFIIIGSMGITYINYVSYVNKINDGHFPYKTSFDKV